METPRCGQDALDTMNYSKHAQFQYTIRNKRQEMQTCVICSSRTDSSDVTIVTTLFS